MIFFLEDHYFEESFKIVNFMPACIGGSDSAYFFQILDIQCSRCKRLFHFYSRFRNIALINPYSVRKSVSCLSRSPCADSLSNLSVMCCPIALLCLVFPDRLVRVWFAHCFPEIPGIQRCCRNFSIFNFVFMLHIHLKLLQSLWFKNDRHIHSNF